MDEFVNILNMQSQCIKFAREIPSHCWLPYLDTQVRVLNGEFSVKWYFESNSKNITRLVQAPPLILGL